MISFIVPAFNEEALIVNCIQSIIREAGNITYEIIVVDNGSTDQTAELARLCGAKVISEPTKGITHARQTGFEVAKYDLVAFIDADNELPPDWLDYALQAVVPVDVVAASGPVSYYELRLSKRLISFLFYLIAKCSHQLFPMLQGGNFILKKAALKKAGGFNTEIAFYGEDTDTAVRLSKIGMVKFDLDMWAYSSARRLDSEGMCKTGGRYIMNYVWIWLFGHPWSSHYHDIRAD